MAYFEVAANQCAGDVGVFGGVVAPGRELQAECAVDVGHHDAILLLPRVVGSNWHGVGGEVERCCPGNRPRLQVVIPPFGLDGLIFGVAQTDAVEVASRQLHRLARAVRAAEVVLKAMTNDNHVAAPEYRHAAIGGQAHRVDADGGGVQRQVGVTHRVVADGVGIDLFRSPNLAVVTHRIGVVPVFALVARCHDPLAKADAHHPGLVVYFALDVAAGELAVVVGADVELAAGERGGGDLQRAGADGRRRDAPHRRIDRVGGDGASECLQDRRARRCLLNGDDAGLVVDAADATGGAGRRIEPPVDFATTVKVGLLSDGKAHAAGDDLFGQGR